MLHVACRVTHMVGALHSSISLQDSEALVPFHPGLHTHTKDPGNSKQLACGTQLCIPRVHSGTSGSNIVYMNVLACVCEYDVLEYVCMNTRTQSMYRGYTHTHNQGNSAHLHKRSHCLANPDDRCMSDLNLRLEKSHLRSKRHKFMCENNRFLIWSNLFCASVHIKSSMFASKMQYAPTRIVEEDHMFLCQYTYKIKYVCV